MHSEFGPRLPSSISDRCGRLIARIHREPNLDGLDHDDLLEEFLLRLHRRKSLVGKVLPEAIGLSVLRQGVWNSRRLVNALKRRPILPIRLFSQLAPESNWCSPDTHAGATDLELVWLVLIRAFTKEETQLLYFWSDHDWDRPRGLARRERRRFDRLRAKLAQHLIKLGYWTGETA